jgi:hypothetical protein
MLARAVLVGAVLVAAAGCGFDTSATFNSDGSVVVGLKFLFPKTLMTGSNGASISGFTPQEIASANAQLQKKYPGGKIMVVKEGDESGALITVPFKSEKEAFGFMTQPSTMSPSGATNGSGVGINLSNTGGLFKTATHSSSGGGDTYTFTTAPQPMPSPAPGEQQVISDDEIASIFVITFSLTVPHVITSAPGALFTIDRKTAIWKLSWTKAQTLTATTGPDTGLAASVSPLHDWRLVIAVGFIALAVGFLVGMFISWRGVFRPAARAAPQPVPVASSPFAPLPPAGDPVAWPGPPPEAPPPTKVP